jgi:hypothetical protein
VKQRITPEKVTCSLPNNFFQKIQPRNPVRALSFNSSTPRSRSQLSIAGRLDRTSSTKTTIITEAKTNPAHDPDMDPTSTSRTQSLPKSSVASRRRCWHKCPACCPILLICSKWTKLN